MLYETIDSPSSARPRGLLNRAGKVITMSAILFSATAAMSLAGQYPVPTATTQSPSINRPCTQIEIAADMLPSECGTLTVAAVVARMYALEGDGNND